MQTWIIASDTFSEPKMMAIIVSPSGCQFELCIEEVGDIVLGLGFPLPNTLGHTPLIH
jgi:hypothetical protein